MPILARSFFSYRGSAPAVTQYVLVQQSSQPARRRTVLRALASAPSTNVRPASEDKAPATAGLPYPPWSLAPPAPSAPAGLLRLRATTLGPVRWSLPICGWCTRPRDGSRSKRRSRSEARAPHPSRHPALPRPQTPVTITGKNRGISGSPGTLVPYVAFQNKVTSRSGAGAGADLEARRGCGMAGDQSWQTTQVAARLSPVVTARSPRGARRENRTCSARNKPDAHQKLLLGRSSEMRWIVPSPRVRIDERRLSAFNVTVTMSAGSMMIVPFPN